jgi:hypothetical protein
MVKILEGLFTEIYCKAKGIKPEFCKAFYIKRENCAYIRIVYSINGQEGCKEEAISLGSALDLLSNSHLEMEKK